MPAFVLSRGPSVQVMDPNPDSGLGQGVFASGEESKERIRPAVESFFSEDLWRALEHGDRLSGFQAHEPGSSRRQPEPAHDRATRARFRVDPTGAESVFRSDSRIVVARRPHDRAPAAAPAVSALYDGRVLSQQCRAFDLSLLADAPGAALFGWSDLRRRLHVFKADRRRRRRLRCRNPHRACRIVPGGGQLQSAFGER